MLLFLCVCLFHVPYLLFHAIVKGMPGDHRYLSVLTCCVPIQSSVYTPISVSSIIVDLPKMNCTCVLLFSVLWRLVIIMHSILAFVAVTINS